MFKSGIERYKQEIYQKYWILKSREYDFDDSCKSKCLGERVMTELFLLIKSFSTLSISHEYSNEIKIV
jgi:hypothetical protein